MTNFPGIMNEKSKGKKARRKPVNMLFVLKLKLEMSLMALQCTLSLSPRMQIQRRGRRRRRNGTNLIHQCGNRQNKGVERGGERLEKEWGTWEGNEERMQRALTKQLPYQEGNGLIDMRWLLLSTDFLNGRHLLRWEINYKKPFVKYWVGKIQSC